MYDLHMWDEKGKNGIHVITTNCFTA